MSDSDTQRLRLVPQGPDLRAPAPNNPLPALSPGQRAWQRFKRNRPAVISAWFLIVLLAIVIAWPLFLSVAGHVGSAGRAFALRHDPDTLSDAQFQPPSAVHWFGTDVHGRDLLSRTLYGAQVSLLVGVVGTVVSLIIGVFWGAVAGYLGGTWDGLMMRFVDSWLRNSVSSGHGLLLHLQC